MKLECISIKGSGNTNEEAYVISQTGQVYAVIDGVSSLVPYENRAGQTGGAIAAELVKRQLEAMPHDAVLPDYLARVNEQLREQMREGGVDLAKKEALWGAACAVVRVKDNCLEYAQSGDCMIFAVYEDDAVRPLTYPQVRLLEQQALASWEAGIREGLSTRVELRERCMEILIHNRYQANEPGGYGVLNGDPACADFVEYGRVNRAGVKALVLATDGLFMPAAFGGDEPGWEETALPIFRKGLQRYADELIALENSDPECIRYPRFKKSDDKTGIVLFLR
ncbi:protein phosphatase 2C domain-containing protein [Brevibacillus agri]|uniref:protein phosphatase 2C domain-containing protein n=1 Tax=Brevibacillus agri TaxID=51101 RepID=UPI0024BF357E|nr:protein phosphatase 2C domain-containing protein [Brevibacillus agri]WHX31741.1 protein phosphatase 2C domain-containing protein [Brevibacillus agri]